MKTILIEIRYHSEPGAFKPYDGLVDGINDIAGEIAQRFSLTLLSVSHVVESQPARRISITCTAICLLNESTTIESIGETLEEENKHPDANLYCFLDRHQKLSVRVKKISYN